MNSLHLHKFLSGCAHTLDILNWLEKEFLPTVVSQLNGAGSRKRLALYGGDRIPENERNLTDSRNRVSLIIEYEFARIISMILESAEIYDLFCAYVVANRFPDLEIRDNQGKLGLRFEVKCLQSIAEEKSANFATLRKDIKPNTDYIVVFLWEWSYERREVHWDRAPCVLDAYVFNASSLATLRDWYWLNRPPNNLDGGYQGFDIRYAVNCSGGKFNEEEGNFGKLLRLWNSKFKYRPTAGPLLLKTERDYDEFKKGVVVSGFRTLAYHILPKLSGECVVSSIEVGTQKLGYKNGDLGFLLASKVRKFGQLVNIMGDHGLNFIWVFRDNYKWQKYRRSSYSIKKIAEGKKPKTIILNHEGD